MTSKRKKISFTRHTARLNAYNSLNNVILFYYSRIINFFFCFNFSHIAWSYNFHKNSLIIFCIRKFFSLIFFLFYPRPLFTFRLIWFVNYCELNVLQQCVTERWNFSLWLSFEFAHDHRVFRVSFNSDHFVCVMTLFIFFSFTLSCRHPEKRQHTTDR